MTRNTIYVFLYPGFSPFEITCLTSLFAFAEAPHPLVTIAADRTPIESEDHFHVLPDQTLSDTDLRDAQLLLLPGIDDFRIPLADQRHCAFLRRAQKQLPAMKLAAISSAPILLAQAGLLDHHQFTAGIFEEFYSQYPFIPKQNLRRQPVVVDGALTTAIGFAFREFAITVARQCHIPADAQSFAEVRQTPPYTAEELTFHLPDA
ncbi:DJ-1/PfpI family protein [Levilactobacillus sp. HBUAS70063]|uniref:DJ-1/PfpI family protein n=1 Tax=Levilactobacillus sp. HBUAS70063 TaxID=3109359 RepID=UPI003132E1A8